MQLKNLLTLTSLALVASCQSMPNANSNPNNIDLVITEPAQCTNFSVKVGAIFQIQLVENITTGYSWELASQSLKTKLVNKDSQPTATTNNRVGTPNLATFTFIADSAGIENITLKYQRPWEKEQPAQEFNCQITVK